MEMKSIEDWMGESLARISFVCFGIGFAVVLPLVFLCEVLK